MNGIILERILERSMSYIKHQLLGALIMVAQNSTKTAGSLVRPPERKAYETPELKQLGTVEELTRWENSVTVGTGD